MPSSRPATRRWPSCRRARASAPRACAASCSCCALRPDLRIEPLRGNLDTRLRKLDEGHYDAIVLAAAGPDAPGPGRAHPRALRAGADAARGRPGRARRSRCAPTTATARRAGGADAPPDLARGRRRARRVARARRQLQRCRWPRTRSWHGDGRLQLNAALGHVGDRAAAAARADRRPRSPTKRAAEALGAQAVAALHARRRRATTSARERHRMPLRLLVTRPQPQADAWVERLRAHGIDAVALPLIAIAAVADLSACTAAWHELPRSAWWSSSARTRSATSLPPGRPTRRALAPRHARGCHRTGHAAGAAPGGRAGRAVRRAARRRQRSSTPKRCGRTCRLNDWRGARCWCVRGDGGRDWLAERLRAAGAAVHFTQAYHRGPAQLDGHRAPAARQPSPSRHGTCGGSSAARGDRHLAATGAQGRLAARAGTGHPPAHRSARARAGLRHVVEAPPTAAAVCASVAQIEACLQSSHREHAPPSARDHAASRPFGSAGPCRPGCRPR